MKSIERLMQELPTNYAERSYQTGAFSRARGIKTPVDLMKLSIFHYQNESSLLETSEVSRMSGIGELSNVAIMNRLAKCGEWFRSINE